MIEKRKEKTMAIKHEDLAVIGNYVQEHLPEWLQAMQYDRSLFARDMDLRERTIRVEEELKTQRELMHHGFAQVDKRFEQVDKRFEQVDKRFEQIDKRFEQVDKRFEQFEKGFTRMTIVITTGFAMVSILITVFKFLS